MMVTEVEELGAGDALAVFGDLREARAAAERDIFLLAAHYADLHHPDSDPSAGGSSGGSQGRSGPAARLPGTEQPVRVGGVGTPPVREFAIAALAVELHLSTWSARRLVADALDTRHRLPGLWEGVRAGQVPPWRAAKVAQATRALTRDQAGLVDAELASVAGDQISYARFADLLEAAVITADPEAAAAAERAAAAQRFAKVGQSNDHGQKTLYVKTSAAEMTRIDATIAYLAEALRTLGDPDDEDTRRSKAVLLLANPTQAVALLQTLHSHRHATGAITDDNSDAVPDGDPGIDPDGARRSGPDAGPGSSDNRGSGRPAESSAGRRGPGWSPFDEALPDPTPGGDHGDGLGAGPRGPDEMHGDDHGGESPPPSDPDPHTGQHPTWETTQRTHRGCATEDPTTPRTGSQGAQGSQGASASGPGLHGPGGPHPGDQGTGAPAAGRDPAAALRQFYRPFHPGQTPPCGCRGGTWRPDPADLLPTVRLYLHLHHDTVRDGHDGVVRWEDEGPISTRYLRDLLGPHARFAVTGVIDLAGQAPVDAYEIPARHREALHLRTPCDVFPYAPHNRRGKQVDHTRPYRRKTPETRRSAETTTEATTGDTTGATTGNGTKGWTPGQTGLDNLGPMTAFHHRVKTHAPGWQLAQPFPGIYLWQAPQGSIFLVDHTGTQQIRRPRRGNVTLASAHAGASLPPMPDSTAGRRADARAPAATTAPASLLEHRLRDLITAA